MHRFVSSGLNCWELTETLVELLVFWKEARAEVSISVTKQYVRIMAKILFSPLQSKMCLQGSSYRSRTVFYCIEYLEELK